MYCTVHTCRVCVCPSCQVNLPFRLVSSLMFALQLSRSHQGWDSNSTIYRLLEMAFQLRLLAQLGTKKDMLMYIP